LSNLDLKLLTETDSADTTLSGKLFQTDTILQSCSPRDRGLGLETARD